MAWTVLIIAGMLEIVWATALKQSEGFTRFLPSVVGIAGALLSFVLLSLALRHLPVGTGYAVWVGVGVVGVAIAGIVAFGEALTVGRIFFLSVIVVGIAGLRLIDG